MKICYGDFVQQKKEKIMTWTILVLVLGIALFMFGGMLLKQAFAYYPIGSPEFNKAQAS